MSGLHKSSRIVSASHRPVHCGAPFQKNSAKLTRSPIRAKILCSLFATSLALGGCAHTDPLDAASIRYSLPRTDVDVSLTLTMRDCKSGLADAELAIAAKPGNQDTMYEVPGAALASARIKRTVDIATYDNGVIKSINTNTEDRSPQIIGNTLKMAVALAGMLGKMQGANLPICQPEVRDAAIRASNIVARINYLRGQLASHRDPKDATEIDTKNAAEIDTLAKELAALRTGILQIQATGTASLGSKEKPVTGGTVQLSPEAFKKWMISGNDAIKPEDAIKQDQALREVIASEFGLAWTATDVSKTATQIGTRKDLRQCGLSLPTPKTKLVEVEVKGVGAAVKGMLDKKMQIPVAQWSDPGQLCIDAGFGETREVDLSFDKFGQTATFKWVSEATAETVSGALAGYGPDIAKIVDSAHGESGLDLQKAEIDKLQTQQKLNQLRACQAVIEAGGYDCTTAK